MDKDLHKQPDQVDTERREFLERLVKSTAFSVPLVLGLDIITSQNARAEEASSSTSSGSSTATSSESSSIWIDPNPVDSGGTTSIPEPSTLAVLGLGLAGLALKARKARLQENEKAGDA